MIKMLLLLAYLAADYAAVAARLAHLEGGLAWSIFAALYLGLAVGLLMLAQIRAAWVRLPLALLFAAAAALQISYQRATGLPLDYEASVGLYLSHASADMALAQFSGVIGAAIAWGGVLFLALAWPPQRFPFATGPALAVPLVSFMVLTVLIYSRDGTGARGTPPGYAALSHALLYVAQGKAAAGAFRHTPLPPPKAPRVAGDVVLIVDESVGEHYLDLTRPDGVRSGLLNPPARLSIVNYGHAAAISGCSVYSNYLMRFGGTQQNYVTAAFQWPSIWAYAHQAGYRTVYLDAQMGNGTLQNMMQPSERAKIDDFVSVGTIPIYLRDLQLAPILARYSHNGRRDFIFINKVGAHFPIINKYPADQARYQPTPPPQPDLWQGFSNPQGSDWSADQWARYRNGYRNALAWSVGHFFDQLLPQIDDQKTLIIYTSDHGLDLHERGTPGLATHCTPQTSGIEQGLVPLVILSPCGAPGLTWRNAQAANHNRATGFRIFPTLLVLMGYDRAAVRAHYGRPLDEPPTDRFARIGRFNGLRGQSPDLVDIDLRKLTPPPRRDYQ